MGAVDIRLRKGWAYIVIDDIPTERKTRDRGSIPVRPGKHTVKLVSDLIEPWTHDVFVSPGETVRLHDITVTFKATRVMIDPTFPDTCLVEVDAASVGTVGSLGRVVALRQERGGLQQVVLHCPEGSFADAFTLHPGTTKTFRAPSSGEPGP